MATTSRRRSGTDPDKPTRQEIKEEMDRRSAPPPYPLKSFEDFKEAFRDSVEHNDEPYQQWMHADKIAQDLTRRFLYVDKTKRGLKIKKQYKWRKWTYLKPAKHERRRKISPLFKAVYAEMWEQALTRSQALDLTEQKGLPHYKGKPLALSIPDISKMAEALETTEDNIRKLIQQWSNPDNDFNTPGPPIRKVGMTKNKNQGGRTIYALGYWNEHPGGKVSFFTKHNSLAWLRSTLFRDNL